MLFRSGIEIDTYLVAGGNDLVAAFAAVAGKPPDAVIVQPSLPNRQAAALALARRLPAVSSIASFPADGGLMSYSPNLAERARLVAGYVDRILKGASPHDLPIQLPTSYDLIVNLKTAKALGLTIPPSILARADEVIE